jgi:3-hydroxyisobutyrate dehydrogenase-like beta-hydroxyacid dehydrogenase
MELGFVGLGRMGASRAAWVMVPSALPVRDTDRA